MIAASQPLPSPMTADGYRGYLVRNTRTSGFKLAVIVGDVEGTRVRARFWRANSMQWTLPVLVELHYLAALTTAERRTRANLISLAREHAPVRTYL